MKLIIDIDEDVRVAITRMGLLRVPDEMQKKVDRAIQGGTPLPKGHGDLVDTSHFEYYLRDTYIDSVSFKREMSAMKHLPTIIEADKE